MYLYSTVNIITTFHGWLVLGATLNAVFALAAQSSVRVMQFLNSVLNYILETCYPGFKTTSSIFFNPK
jgi:Na+/phosphate symporter